MAHSLPLKTPTAQQSTPQHGPTTPKPVEKNAARYGGDNKNKLPGAEHPTHCRMTQPEISLNDRNQRGKSTHIETESKIQQPYTEKHPPAVMV